jgi:ferredoxin
MPTVKFINEKKTIEVEEGANLRREARKAGVQVYAGVERVLNCRGFGVCTNCQVQIKKGTENVSKQGFWEKMNMLNVLMHPFTFFARLGHEESLRLACRTKVYGDIEVETNPPMNWHGDKFWG